MPPIFFFFLVSILGQQAFADEPEAIVQGTRARLGEFPYQVSLNEYGHFCGGSIIAPTKILTAAHCVEDTDAKYLKIITGTVHSDRGQTHSVRSIAVHEGYRSGARAAWVNDIAVITLTAPIQYDKYQSAIPLAISEIPAGQHCISTGWGEIYSNGPQSSNLLMMEQTTLSLEQCKTSFRSFPLSNKHLCALNYSGSGACRGDSGGPFVCNGRQYGVTSFSVPCARGKPDVYANVYNCRDFILRNM